MQNKSFMGFVDHAKSARSRIISNTMGNYVVFHHVPKCGGTSVARALRMKYILSQVTIKPEQTYRSLEAFSAEPDREKLLVDVLDLREQMLLYWLYDDVRCISAHVRYSEHAYREFSDRYKFITTLREPVDRFISHFFWVKGHPNSHSYISAELDEFLGTKTCA